MNRPRPCPTCHQPYVPTRENPGSSAGGKAVVAKYGRAHMAAIARGNKRPLVPRKEKPRQVSAADSTPERDER